MLNILHISVLLNVMHCFVSVPFLKHLVQCSLCVPSELFVLQLVCVTVELLKFLFADSEVFSTPNILVPTK